MMFGFPQKTYREGKDYELVDDARYEQQIVRVLTGPYKNLVYGYGGVQLGTVDGVANLKFTYEVVDDMTTCKNKRRIEAHGVNPKFLKVAGDILCEIISNHENI
jgi:hypothetical protein